MKTDVESDVIRIGGFTDLDYIPPRIRNPISFDKIKKQVGKKKTDKKHKKDRLIEKALEMSARLGKS